MRKFYASRTQLCVSAGSIALGRPFFQLKVERQPDIKAGLLHELGMRPSAVSTLLG